MCHLLVNLFFHSHLRLDTLGRMLTYGNVHAGINALVVETCQGLLLGAVLERLGGTYLRTYVICVL